MTGKQPAGGREWIGPQVVIPSMTNTKTVTIESAERLGCSHYGNPYYALNTSEGRFRTQINAMINFGIENPENINRPVCLHLTKAGRVYNVTPVD